MSFIRALLDVLFPQRSTSLGISTSTLESVGQHVSPTTEGMFTSLLPYRIPVVRSLIVEAKFHETSHAFRILGSVLAEYLITLEEESPFEENLFVLVPVPLSKKRFRERGYNQVEQILVEAMKLLPDTFILNTHLVRRVRDTTAQTSLGRSARLRNMDEAFVVSDPINPRATYIVIDDVATTGATLTAVSAALHEANSGSILLVALAH